jgi:hypothetical protein|tara:strand:- start:440 stop:763 length:324 start_codon:yes stop_codon:yes gene_type:complete
VANTFKNAGVAVGSSETVIYTTASSTTAVIHAIYLSNVHGTNDGTADIYVTDDSAGSDFYIAKNLTVPKGATVVLDKPVNLETADVLKCVADASSTIQIFCSVLEIT